MKLIKSIMSAFAIVLATTACAGNLSLIHI